MGSMYMADNNIPKSRVNITYDMEVNGIKKAKELAFKQLVIGDFSQGNSKESSYTLSNRKVYDIESNNLDSVMQNIGARFTAEVSNQITPDGDPIEVDLPIDSMKAFNPNKIAERIPELKKLIKMKELLKEYEALLDNNRKLRNFVNKKLNSAENLGEVRKSLPEEATKAYKLLD